MVLFCPEWMGLRWQHLVQPPVGIVGVFVELAPQNQSLGQVFFPHADGHAHPLFANDETVDSFSWWGSLSEGVEEVCVLLSLAGVVAQMGPVAGEMLVQQGHPEPAWGNFYRFAFSDDIDNLQKVCR